ncbi:hypothetical protein AB6C57_17785 [Vibrio splendidus]
MTHLQTKQLLKSESNRAWELGKEDIKSADFEIIGEVVWTRQRM